MTQQNPIGVFDSGYGGLTVLKDLVGVLPNHDFIYLGDNARAPYGNRSFETVHAYTLQCVQHLFKLGCRLVILACNTASAKALRTIQQVDLPRIDPSLRVLGVIRPTTEVVGHYTKTGHVGILGTTGTVQSESYPIEIEKYFPEIKVFQQACPMWVPLIENNEFENPGADYFISKYLDALFVQSNRIDTLILGCTHYPILAHLIRRHIPDSVTILSQGPVVSASLINYLQRHPEIDERCSRNGRVSFITTDDPQNFDMHSRIFFGRDVKSTHLELQAHGN